MRRDFNAFVRACEKYGRQNLADIAREIESKTEEEVGAGRSAKLCGRGGWSAPALVPDTGRHCARESKSRWVWPSVDGRAVGLLPRSTHSSDCCPTLPLHPPHAEMFSLVPPGACLCHVLLGALHMGALCTFLSPSAHLPLTFHLYHQVRAYAKVFWERYAEINDHEKVRWVALRRMLWLSVAVGITIYRRQPACIHPPVPQTPVSVMPQYIFSIDRGEQRTHLYFSHSPAHTACTLLLYRSTSRTLSAASSASSGSRTSCRPLPPSWRSTRTLGT